MRWVLLPGVLVLLLAVCGRDAPAAGPLGLWKKGGKERIVALNLFKRDVARRRKAQKEFKLTEQDRKFLQALVADADNAPSVRYEMTEVFVAIGRKTGECMAYCKALAGRKEAGQVEIREVLKIFTGLKIATAEARDIVIPFLEVEGGWRGAGEYLVREFRTDPVVSDALVKALGKAKEWHACFLTDCLKKTGLTRKSAIALTSMMKASLLAKDKGREAARRAKLLVRGAATVAAAHPHRFEALLSAKEASEFLAVAKKTDDIGLRFYVVICLFTMPRKTPDGILGLATLDSRKYPVANRVLTASGFMKPRKLDAKHLSQLLAAAKTSKSPEAKAGFFSLYWRSKGDAAAALKNRGGKFHGIHSAYAETFPLADPEKADLRRMWTYGARQPALKRLVADRLWACRKLEDVAWVLEQAVGEEELQQKLLASLWRMRHRLKEAKLTDKSRKWLTGVSGGKDLNDALLAAGCLAYAFEDKAPALKLAAKHKYAELFSSSWPAMLDVLLRADPKHELIDRHLAELKKTGPEAKWLIWLADLRRGKRPGAPPIRDLCAALEKGGQWAPALAEAGKDIYPHLEALRTPHIILGSGVGSSGPIMKYLGALDRLELERLR